MLEWQRLPCGKVMHALRKQGNIFSEVLRLAFARHNPDDAASGALCDPSQDD